MYLNPDTDLSLYFKFFSGKVACVMKQYMNRNTPGFEDAGPTIKFIERINTLSDAMNSRLPWEALRASEDSETNKVRQYLETISQYLMRHYRKFACNSQQVIKTFLEYLDDWVSMKGVVRDFKLSAQAEVGLFVSLKGALELVQHLNSCVGFKYLMTRRINQDALEVSKSRPILHLAQYNMVPITYKIFSPISAFLWSDQTVLWSKSTSRPHYIYPTVQAAVHICTYKPSKRK